MRRVGNLYPLICTKDNIEIADDKARRNKKHRWGIIKHDKHRDEENNKLLDSFINHTYKTSEYHTYKIYEPKEREIFRLPYYPDRIAHHSIMNVVEDVWVKTMIPNTYSCIKGRGIKKCVTDVKKALKDEENTTYCLKLDIRKFYPSIKHHVLKRVIERKIKDKNLLSLLNEIIDSTDGVPIGNYLSQFFANLTLTPFDHWIKEELKIKYYFRYADDIVILSNDKNWLRTVLILIKIYVHQELELEIKDNYQVFPVDSRGIDFVGYKFYHRYTLVRKDIKKKIYKIIKHYKDNPIVLKQKMLAYYGWLKLSNSKKLLAKIDELTNMKFTNLESIDSNISKFYNKNVFIVDIVQYSNYFKIYFRYKNKIYNIKSKVFPE